MLWSPLYTTTRYVFPSIVWGPETEKLFLIQGPVLGFIAAYKCCILCLCVSAKYSLHLCLGSTCLIKGKTGWKGLNVCQDTLRDNIEHWKLLRTLLPAHIISKALGKCKPAIQRHFWEVLVLKLSKILHFFLDSALLRGSIYILGVIYLCILGEMWEVSEWKWNIFHCYWRNMIKRKSVLLKKSCRENWYPGSLYSHLILVNHWNDKSVTARLYYRN